MASLHQLWALENSNIVFYKIYQFILMKFIQIHYYTVQIDLEGLQTKVLKNRHVYCLLLANLLI